MKERDVSIDVLRWLALTGIILVHIGPSPFWNQLRSFDVPMMVFLSSVCFHVSRDYKSYCVRRFERLVVPVWIFLTVYFAVKYIFWGIVPSAMSVIKDYTLMTRWYVWIIRIFLFMALLAPFINKIVCRAGKRYPFLFVGGLLVNEILGYVLSMHFHIYTLYIVMTFSYALIYSLGIYLCRMEINRKAIILGWGGTNCIIYIAIAVYLMATTGEYQLTNIRKYPPRLYYISYALFLISILWAYRNELARGLAKLRLLPVCTYIGSHSLWIYLWHIPLIELIGYHTPLNATLRFLTVYAIAVIVAYVQTQAVTLVCDRYVKSEGLRRKFKLILIG